MLPALTVLTLNAVLAPFLFRWLGRRSFYALAVAPAGVFVWLLTVAVRGTEGMELSFPWIPELGVSLALRMDPLSLMLSMLVTGIGALVLAYCAQYFLKANRTAVGHAMFAGQLTAFAAAMFLLVTADDLMILFIAWEATTVLSYLMIGFSRTRLTARRAALQALIVTTAGGLSMLVGFLILASAAGTMRISSIVERLAAGTVDAPEGFIVAAAVLVFVGAASKSALVPSHFWLPGAMAAPTPVSAYLHAAAMVKAGIYLVARFAPAFLHVDAWLWLVVLGGVATMLLGGYRALRQFDLKLILAYGTVSQLGFLTLVVGLGKPEFLHAGAALLMGHALFKATLFLVVGIIDQCTGTRDIRQLAGLARRAPILFATALVAAASMAGVPFTLGFVAKESVLEALLHGATDPLGVVALIGAVLGSILTVAYSGRFVLGAFGDGRFFKVTEARVVRRIAPSFAAPAIVLAVLTVVFGVFPAPIEALVHGVGETGQALLGEHGKLPHLAIWHGFTTALLLSALCLGVGAALILGRARVSRVQDALGGSLEGDPPLRRLDAERLYRQSVGALDDFAIWLTGRTQRGSVGFYVSIILAVAVSAPLVAYVAGGGSFGLRLHLADSAAQIVIVVVVGIAALAAVKADKRFLAVLLVSVVGYGMAVIYALQGAPDLALTQVLVETVVTVAMVLALRVLPARMEPAWQSRHKLIRAVLGVAFGTGMVFLAAAAMNARESLPVSLEFPRLAYDGGGGANIVNVTLVDIRAWDTFGEVSVLAIAATGVASLIFVSGRGDQQLHAGFSSQVASGAVQRGGAHDADRFSEAPRSPWITAGHTLDSGSRSIMLEVVVRIVFHTLIIVSVYLLVAGHNAPGGGFAAGLMAGLALAVRYFAGGRYELYEAMPISAGTMLGSGLGIIALSAIVPLFFGGEVLQAAIVQGTVPLLGGYKFTTSTIFDIGVFLIVVGLVSDVLRSFGSRLDWLAGRQQISSDRGPDNAVTEAEAAETKGAQA
ncbi:Na+/H+ antiporter subunit A [Falsarthrobacter nasiphocae]|uniref:Multicomponent Na+:H+ antiporter subunit A n=1 Tax=Falsarthrobacter nasiphocae TaxID=189863 RepID=A0AAE4C8D2_9MICC|nr:Na+/H+ antiporter subunit A [Falsarthrobacter nasiphocae]MDR6892285.1 multicomponent Na+:H+ antiporter subunit A [Falsarthrobacter nasiphocae]